MAVSDIRLSVDFFDHPKTVKLERRHGLPGLKALLVLWTWAAKNRTSGDLSGLTDEDVEIAAGWTGEEGTLVAALASLRWLDGEEKARVLHEWAVHNPWAADAERRSNRARFTRMGSTHPALYRQLCRAGYEEITREEYEELIALEGNQPTATLPTDVERDVDAALTPSPSPSPAPSPEDRERLGLSTDLSTDLYTCEHEALLKALYSLAPECVADWKKDGRWLEKVQRDFPGLDLEHEMQRAKAWLGKRERVAVEDPKGFFYAWLTKAEEIKTTGRATR